MTVGQEEKVEVGHTLYVGVEEEHREGLLDTVLVTLNVRVAVPEKVPVEHLEGERVTDGERVNDTDTDIVRLTEGERDMEGDLLCVGEIEGVFERVLVAHWVMVAEGDLDREGLPEMEMVTLFVLVTLTVRVTLRVEEEHIEREGEGVPEDERVFVMEEEGVREVVPLVLGEVVKVCGRTIKGYSARRNRSIVRIKKNI